MRWRSVIWTILIISRAVAQDVGVTTITAPVSACMPGNNKNVTVQIFNDDNSMLNTAFDVTCIVSGPISDSITENINTLILAKSIYTYTFTQTVNLSAPGTYTFKAYTSLNGDTDNSDDTLSGYIVISDTLSDGGAVSDSGLHVCTGMNDSLIQLLNYTGSILHWESSTDNGNSWNTISNIADTIRYTNLVIPTWYRAVVKNGACPRDTSSVTAIYIDTPGSGGTLTGNDTVCASGNHDTLSLNGYTGDIIHWELSGNGGSTWTNINDTTDTITYTNLTATTMFRAAVKNGACPVTYPNPVTINVDQPSAGGILPGSAVACTGNNSGTISLTGHNGNILYWEASADSGQSWLNIGNTTAGESYIDLSQSTWYRVIVQNGVCPRDTSSVARINVVQPPAVSTGPDTVINTGDTIMLTGNAEGTWYWTPGQTLNDSTVLTPLAWPVQTTTYYLFATDTNSCTAYDSVNISVYSTPPPPDTELMITNTITANGDGINDTWYIQNIGLYPDAEVFVYNIYGNEVFHSTAYDNQWGGTYNGSLLPDGTYYYIVRLKEANTVYKGTITLLGNLK